MDSLLSEGRLMERDRGLSDRGVKLVGERRDNCPAH